MKLIGNKWDEVLEEEYQKPYFDDLINKVDHEYKVSKVYPAPNKIFASLKYTDYDDVKVVILGQDPYHGAGQAHGVAFSVLPGIKTPPSLVNIYKEIVSDIGGFVPDNGYLVPWAKQGVLLLNTVLTVREGEPNSHHDLGWEQFTDAVISSLNKKSTPVVFLLWGANAKQKAGLIDTKKHKILYASHPSPLSAHNGFFGCKHFSQANKFLVEHNLTPIDWQIQNIAPKLF